MNPKITNKQIKLIKSLHKKKYRQNEKLFICEGKKIIDTLINSKHPIKNIFATNKFIEKRKKQLNNKYTTITETELKKISTLTTPQQALAITPIIQKNIKNITTTTGIHLILDKIKDPGNLGTIIRIADWFGIKNIICSNDTVDAYNPKTIQATMGAIFNTNIYYTNLQKFLSENQKIKTYGTFTNGKNIYNTKTTQNAFIIIGNETNGISPEITKLTSTKITIPNFNNTKITESLNAATATAIICSEFCRKNQTNNKML